MPGFICDPCLDSSMGAAWFSPDVSLAWKSMPRPSFPAVSHETSTQFTTKFSINHAEKLFINIHIKVRREKKQSREKYFLYIVNCTPLIFTRKSNIKRHL
jgi:hypothetical protein